MAQSVPKNSNHEEKYSGGKTVMTGYKASAHTHTHKKAHIHSSSSFSNNNNNNNKKTNDFVLIWKSRFIEG